MLAKSLLASLLLALALPASSDAHGGGAGHEGRSAQHRRLAQFVAPSPSPASASPLLQSTPVAALDKRADETVWKTATVTQTNVKQLTIRAAPASATDAAATASMATIISGSTTWTSQGCVQDGSRLLLQDLKLYPADNTPAACVALCLDAGFPYAGVELSTRCFCGASLYTASGLGATIDDSRCQETTCPGDSSLNCGGSKAMLLYKQEQAVLSKATITSGDSKWTWEGCVQDGSRLLLQDLKLYPTGNTPAVCIAACLDAGYSYAGVELETRCFCSNSLYTASGLGATIDDARCQETTCPGDNLAYCGGSKAMILYKQAPPAMSKATITSGDSKWTWEGCVQDGAKLLLQDLKLYPADNTPAVCVAACLAAGFSYAGVELETRCFCSNSLYTASGLGATIDDSRCQETACPGDNLQSCGGSKAMILYKKYVPALSKASIKSGSTTWTFQGCVQDGAKLLLQGLKAYPANMTPTTCVALCLSKGFTYSGVELGTRCFCGSSLNTDGGLGATIDDARCQETTCAGDSTLFCGGSKAMILYKSSAAATSSSVAASSSSASKSSSSVAASSSSASKASSSASQSSSSASKSSSSSSASKTSSSSAASATPTAKWTFSHCASDYPYAPQAGRALSGAGPLTAPAGSAGMTNVLCQSMCEAKGFTLAGTENGNECWCGSELDNGNGFSTAASDCSYACAGDASDKCGGGWRLSIYASAKQKQWSAAKTQQGSTFFDGWDWYSGPDPTNGFVDYLTWQDAFSLDLASINSAGQAIMKVETTPVVTSAGRKSTRISTSWQFNAGSLLIMDAAHMPVGCGVWPAWWTLGNGAWPYTGEIDILEGVHFYTNNLQSVHTGSGCSIPSSFGGTGTLVGSTNCDSYATGNTGCGIQNNAGTPNYGVPFNNNGGGVYAMLWTELHIMVYFFPRGSIPADIASSAPTPNKGTWGQPIARWPATACSPLSNYFKNHAGIFDITFCGDWSGNAWTNGYPDQGQPTSCQALTGYATCSDYVQNRGGDFGEAYWTINYVKLFQ